MGTWRWIAWWSLHTIAACVIMMWIYNNTRGSVFAAALFHTTLNLGWQLFPVNGSHLDYRITGCLTGLVAALVVLASGPRDWLR